MFLQVGSPLDARHNPLVYLVIVFLAIAVGIVFALFLLSKIIKKFQSSPEYIEKQKQRITTIKDVQALSKKLNLTQEETKTLFKVCLHTHAKNIFYSYEDDTYVEQLFKAEYQHRKRHNYSDKEFYNLFRLRFQIDKAVSFSRFITSSTNIPIGTILSYIAPNGFQYQFTLTNSDKNGLYLSVPDTLTDDSEDRPDKLRKITLIFNLPNGQQYAIIARVIQFMTMPDDSRILHITHSTTLCPQSRRTSKRFTVNRDCSFSAVEVSQDAKGNMNFNPKEKQYDGVIVDLSEGGCKLFANLPIKPKQYIYLRFEILGKEEGVLGYIADTRTDFDSGMYSIHIGFKNFSLQSKIRLLADLYDYES